MQQYKYLNFLKGLAIFGVILVHSPQKITGLDSNILLGVHFGAFGCQLFFLISGFLAVESWNRVKKSGQPYYLFYRRRFLSIAPIYILFVVFYQLLAYLSSIGGISLPFYICRDSMSVVANMLLLQGVDFHNFNSVVPGGWFIGTITLFYVLYPFLDKCHRFFVSKYTQFGPYVLTACSVVVSFIIQYLIMNITGDWRLSKPGSFLYYSILNQLPCLTLGIALHDIKNNSQSILRNIELFILGFTITNCLYLGLRLHYWIYCFIPCCLGISFVYLFLGVRYWYHKKETFKYYGYVESAGRLSYSAYFTNFLACWIFPWCIQILLKYYGVFVDPMELYFILLIPIFLLTFVLVPPVDFIINRFKNLL